MEPATPEPTTPLRGLELLKAAINQIIAHPATWEQSTWHSDCGTRHCLAGWCQILGGRVMSSAEAEHDARDMLQLSNLAATWLFAGYRTLPEIYDFTQMLIRARNPEQNLARTIEPL